MKKNIKKTSTKVGNIENVLDQDWPLLKEIDKTRFVIKKKNNINTINQSFEKPKEASEKKDEIISAFEIENKNVEDISKTKNKQISKRILITENKIQQNNLEFNIKENKNILHLFNGIFNKALFKLLTTRLRETYLNKINDILDRLMFIINNAKQISIGLFQIFIPALITFYLINEISFISSEIKKQTILIKFIYGAIFYFACLFLWISCQVIAVEILNTVKHIKNNLLKAKYKLKSL